MYKGFVRRLINSLPKGFCHLKNDDGYHILLFKPELYQQTQPSVAKRTHPIQNTTKGLARFMLGAAQTEPKMTPSTLYQSAIGALRYRLTAQTTPLNVMISVTDQCNAHCAYCAIPERGYPHRPTTALKRLIDQCATAGTQRIGFWGGEPLMRKDMGALIEHAAKQGIWTTMVSNGRLYPQYADQLEQLDHLLISLDGNQSQHDAHRGAGSWAGAMNAIREARARGRNVWALCVLSKEGLSQIEEVLAIAEKYDLKAAFQVLHHPPSLDGGKSVELLPTHSEYQRIIHALMAAKKAGRPVANSQKVLAALLDWPDFSQPMLNHRHAGIQCLAGKLFCNIDSNGELYPCSLRIGTPDAPNAFTEGFQSAFDHLRSPPCQACTATAFMEYNILFGLDLPTIAGWIRNLR